MFDYLIVGAGLAGCVLAERLANVKNKKVLLVDKRNHVGGNCHDYHDNAGILVHKYGPHYFRTDNKSIIDYLSRFTDWHYHQYKILAYVDGQTVPLPINLDTINTLYGLKLSSFEVADFFEKVREPVTDIATSRDVVVNQVGQELYEKFFKGYTTKQWGLDPSELAASVCARIPVRSNRDGRYFNARYQMMPKHGYTRMFMNMIDHPGIHLLLQTDFKTIRDQVAFDTLIYTGPIDEFFDYQFGPLPYRSLRFDFETLDREWFQPVSQVNYPNDYDFTRIVEIKHATGQQHPKTTIVREYPADTGEPFYPIPREQNRMLYEKYRAAADILEKVFFVGRLAQYQYLNMDEVVTLALNLFDARFNA